MGIKSSILVCTSAIVGLTALSTPALAQPAVASQYWGSNLSFNQCMDSTSAVMKELSFTNITRHPTAVGAIYGDYNALVTCLTAKGVIFVTVSGPDASTAQTHVQSISQKIQNTR